MSNNTKETKGLQFGSEAMAKILVGIFIVAMIGYGLFYWFGGPRELDNLKDSMYEWTQNAIVLDKTNHWWGDSCLLNADDGKRYYDDSCTEYVNGDKVTIMMYKDRLRWIEGISP
jgi:hypothetical protein